MSKGSSPVSGQPNLPGVLAKLQHHPAVNNFRALHTGRPQDQLAASEVISRYGSHLLVLVVVLLVALVGASPTLQARANAVKPGGVSDNIDYSQIDRWLDNRNNEDAANPTSGFLNNTASPYTRTPGRLQTYQTQEGDTPQAVAERFKLEPPTVLAANGLYDPQAALPPGKELIILPVDGTYHVVGAGDTLESVAGRYQVEPTAISGFKQNSLEPPYTLTAGRKLIVPGGVPVPREAIISYHVHEGDTLEGLGELFGLSKDTIIAANPNLNPDEELTEGAELRILPIDGVPYQVREGDLLKTIAAGFEIDPRLLVEYPHNGIKSDADLKAGREIIVPGGQVAVVEVMESVVDSEAAAQEEEEIAEAPVAEPAPAEAAVPPPAPAAKPAPAPAKPAAAKPAAAKPAAATKPAAKPAAASRQTSSRGATAPAAAKPAAPKKPATTKKTAPAAKASMVGTGRFIWPVGGVVTQYFSRKHNGLDIANRSGTPLRAADSGEVIWSGWRKDGLGYAVLIDHNNGYVTVYGHMVRQPPVRVGQAVARGQVIGYMGSTGRSTGPHVHFIIRSPSRNYMNPLRFLNK